MELGAYLTLMSIEYGAGTVESLYCPPDTDITLYVNYTGTF